VEKDGLNLDTVLVVKSDMGNRRRGRFGGGAGVEGGGAAPGEVPEDVDVAEGDVVAVRIGELAIGDGGGAAFQVLIIGGEAVGHGDEPAVAVSGREAAEGSEVGGMVGDGLAPYVEAEVREMDGLALGVAEDGGVGRKGDRGGPGSGEEGVMIAGEEDDGPVEGAKGLEGVGDFVGGGAGGVEEVAGDEEGVGAGVADGLEDGVEAAAGLLGAFAADVNVGRVD